MDPLFSLFEVTVTAPHDGDAVPLGGHPDGVCTLTATLTADRVEAVMVVEAHGLAEAALLGCIAAGPWARMAKAEAAVKPVAV